MFDVHFFYFDIRIPYLKLYKEDVMSMSNDTSEKKSKKIGRASCRERV